MKRLAAALRQTVGLIRADQRIWLPFLVTVTVEVLLLLLVWLAPHPPYSKFFAPPIRYFFSDAVLHYPWHLLFLYHVMKHTNVIAAVLVGAYMTGIACAMVGQRFERQPMSLRNALVSRKVRYGRVVLLWTVLWGTAKLGTEWISRQFPPAPWLSWALVAGLVLFQSLMVYAIPISVFTGANWFKSIGRSAMEACRHPMTTLAPVMVFSVPLILFMGLAPMVRVSQWMKQFAPELVLVFIAVRLMLWMLSDALLTLTISHLWWLRRTPAHVGQLKKPLAAPAPAPRVSKRILEEGPAVA